MTIHPAPTWICGMLFLFTSMAQGQTTRPAAEEADLPWGEAAHGAQVAVTPEDQEVGPDDPVFITIHVRALGEESVELLNPNDLGVNVKIKRGETDATYPLRIIDATREFLKWRSVEVQPGEVFTRRMRLDRWYDMSISGEFDVQVHMSIVISTPPNEEGLTGVADVKQVAARPVRIKIRKQQ